MIEADRLWFGLGAQNVHWVESGAFTGEVSSLMLAKLSVDHVIVGHSERRQGFGETDEMVAKKAKAVAQGMRPIVCVGETLEQREAGEAEGIVVSQVVASWLASTREPSPHRQSPTSRYGPSARAAPLFPTTPAPWRASSGRPSPTRSLQTPPKVSGFSMAGR